MIQLKAVIFDYGNVLCESQQPEDLEGMAGVAGLDLPRFEEIYWRKRLPYDRAELTPREYWDDFCAMAGIPVFAAEQLAEVMGHDSRSWSHINPVMASWAQRLRGEGMKTAVLSNMPLPLREHLDSIYPWLHEFDHRVFSCDVRLVKPEAAIYRMSLEGLGVSPEEALFLDDRPDNIRAAKDLGIHGLLFTTAADAAEQLNGRYALPSLPV